ncbi:MAG: glycosyltransferase family 2 protein [Candidatus Saccharimonadales bacterium]
MFEFRPQPLRIPTLLSFGMALAVIISVSALFFRAGTQMLQVFTSIVWSLPIAASVLGLYSVYKLRRSRNISVTQQLPQVRDLLIVEIPTIGRYDVLPALSRSVASFCAYLTYHFRNVRIEIIAEENAEALGDIHDLAQKWPKLVQVIVVPRSYKTSNGTRFKARANHYAHEQRIRKGEARDDVWVLHMDDDTGVHADTAYEIAAFIARQSQADNPKHLAQGVLTYPLQYAVNKWTWLADSVRPADDVARFHLFTGGGNPIAGLHGELLLIRASVEAQIGWDFGPNAITEDAQFALIFSRLFPGRSGWFPGRCYGASPATVRDFIKQRRRWSSGLFGLVLNRSILLRKRYLIAYCMLTWILGPFQHVVTVLLVGFLLGNTNTSPIARPILVLWAVNLAYVVWMYWEGHRMNASASGLTYPKFTQRVALLSLIPVFSLWEGIGGMLGVLDHLRKKAVVFTVIAKPT